MNRLGLGIGWRPELALFIERRAGLCFVGIVAEHFGAEQPIPQAIQNLQARRMRVIVHALSLSLGGAEKVDGARVDALARLAERVDAPLVSEHIAFVRAGGVESGHLLPIPRTREALDVLVE